MLAACGFAARALRSRERADWEFKDHAFSTQTGGGWMSSVGRLPGVERPDPACRLIARKFMS